MNDSFYLNVYYNNIDIFNGNCSLLVFYFAFSALNKMRRKKEHKIKNKKQKSYVK